MTKNYGALFGGSSHPHGRGEEPKPREFTIQGEGILEKKSISNLVFLIREQERMIKYLQAELKFYKEQLSFDKGDEEFDWRGEVQ